MKNTFFLLFFIIPTLSFSTHLRGGQITVTKTNGLTCTITIRAFTNTASPIQFSNGGAGILDFGDGTVVNPPQQQANLLPGQSFEVGFIEYSVSHTYSASGFYVITYLEHNLDAGILNITSSVTTPFILETGVVVSLNHDYSSPHFPADPILFAFTGMSYSYSAAAVDSANRIYQYKLVTAPPEVVGYQIPENFSINLNTGLITWDTQFNATISQGKYYFYIQVLQYDENNNYLGYVNRSFEIILEDGLSNFSILNPITDPNGRVLVMEGQQKLIKVILTDPAGADSLRWSVYFDQKISGNVSFAQYDSTLSYTRVGILNLQTSASIERDFPYNITLRGTIFGPQNHHHNPVAVDICFQFFTKDVQLPVITGSVPQEKGIIAYPNPFSNFLFVDGLKSTAPAIFINSLGQRILQTEVNSNDPLDCSQLPPGIYIFQIVYGDRLVRQKLVKK